MRSRKGCAKMRIARVCMVVGASSGTPTARDDKPLVDPLFKGSGKQQARASRQNPTEVLVRRSHRQQGPAIPHQGALE